MAKKSKQAAKKTRATSEGATDLSAWVKGMEIHQPEGEPPKTAPIGAVSPELEEVPGVEPGDALELPVKEAQPLTITEEVDIAVGLFSSAFPTLMRTVRRALGTADSVKLLVHQKEWMKYLKELENLVKPSLKDLVLQDPQGIKEGATTKLVIGDWEVPVSVANQPPAPDELLEPKHVDPQKLVQFLAKTFTDPKDQDPSDCLRGTVTWSTEGLSPVQDKSLRALLRDYGPSIRAECLKDPGPPTLRPLKMVKTAHPLPEWPGLDDEELIDE